jgi:hypothetical protein
MSTTNSPGKKIRNSGKIINNMPNLKKIEICLFQKAMAPNGLTKRWSRHAREYYSTL